MHYSSRNVPHFDSESILYAIIILAEEIPMILGTIQSVSYAASKIFKKAATRSFHQNIAVDYVFAVRESTIRAVPE